MKKRSTSLAGITSLLLLAAMAVAGCSTGATATDQDSNIPPGHQFRADTQGQVTIEATWEHTGNALVFDIAMNTHSVELDGYDLSELAVLRDSTGAVYEPLGWDSAPGGHHRRGALAFPVPDEFSSGIGFIELAIHDVAGISERTFRWDL